MDDSTTALTVLTFYGRPPVRDLKVICRGVDLCKNVGGSKLQSAGEMKILNSAVTKQCLFNKPYIIGVKINVDSC